MSVNQNILMSLIKQDPYELILHFVDIVLFLKAVTADYAKRMDHPSNVVSMMGFLRPVFMDEELYLRRLFKGEDSYGYTSDWEGGEIVSVTSKGDGNHTSSTVYRLEVTRIELFSVYGIQACTLASAISLEDFQDAEPDILVNSTPAIVDRFSEKGISCDFALRSLCKKKGLPVEIKQDPYELILHFVDIVLFLKAVTADYAKRMDHPSNVVSMMGFLRPVFMDEELYLRRLFKGEDSYGYTSDWEGGEIVSVTSKGDGNHTSSTVYRLEVTRIELFSVYGIQACTLASAISLEDFQDAEPDILVNSTPAIVDRFSEKGISCDFALRSLCKKKGLPVEGAILIGVDSLGMDVRVFSGIEVRTHRFPFKVRATSERAAEKQIQQLLFPQSRRKKIRTQGDRVWDVDSF
ncbi:unnamed protein product [Ilex paraguariensis]|uniref:Uncharacterized protein n=2 Tax=Ilex paraguariensis TaxID=185542 RepID=A0ABC8UWS6_9AQUA